MGNAGSVVPEAGYDVDRPSPRVTDSRRWKPDPAIPKGGDRQRAGDRSAPLPESSEFAFEHPFVKSGFPALPEEYAINPLMSPQITEFPEITKEFELAKTPSLGNPFRPIETTTDAYIAVHEHAMVLFLSPILDIFVLPNDGERKAVRQPTASYQDDRKWFDDEYLRTVFDSPQDENPPEYRIADLWSKSPAIIWLTKQNKLLM
jgi:hypothetical protein